MREFSAQRRERVLRKHREWVHRVSTRQPVYMNERGYIAIMAFLHEVEDFVLHNKLEDTETLSYFGYLETSETVFDLFDTYPIEVFRGNYPEYGGFDLKEAIERANDNRKDNNQWFSLLPCGHGIIETHIPNHGY